MINLANEVFGFNGWSSSIQNVQIDFVDENPSTGKINLGLSTIVRVTLRDGTHHEDIGYGHIENCKGKAAAFEKAKKEGATDALKRALRTFGNVLGNCLYDKDYLAKVTRVKVAPSKWDAENLYRHAEYAPVKKESIAEADARVEKDAGASKRQLSAQSGNSFGSAEFQDDFGGALLNEDDFVHADEVQLDDTSMLSAVETPAQRAVNGPQGQQNGAQRAGGMQRMHSMPQLRPPNVQAPPPVQGVQAMQKPQAVQRPSTNALPGQAGKMAPPSVVQNGGPRGPQQNAAQHIQSAPQRPSPQQQSGPQQPYQRQHQPPHQQNHPQNHQAGPSSEGSRSNPSSATTVADIPANNINQHAVQNADGQFLDDQGLPLPCNPPPDAPQGFVTGRSVDLLKEPPGARPDVETMKFNPNADSPSIRRTHGVNPGKSAPIRRHELGGGGAAGGTTQHGGGATNGPTTPMRTNFVNPAADMNRRIGAPNGGGMSNRGQYRPPTSVGRKRPALADVSNTADRDVAHLDGAGDAKKAKLEAPGPQGGEGGQQQTDGAVAAS